MSTLLEQLSQQYPPHDPYTRSLLATAFGTHNGLYDLSYQWSPDLFLKYALAKYQHHTLTVSDWTFIVNAQLEMHFHGLSDSDLDILVTLIPTHRTPWFQYMQTIYPHYTFSTLPPSEAFTQRVNNEPIAQHTLATYLSLSEQDKDQLSHDTLLLLFKYIEQRVDNLSEIDNNVLKCLFMTNDFSKTFQKEYKKKTVDLRLIMHCPVEIKPKKTLWTFPLKHPQALDCFKQFPSYLTSCCYKDIVNPFTDRYFSKIRAYAQHTPSDILTAWLQTQENMILEPWLWLPLDLLPTELREIRETCKITCDSSTIDLYFPNVYSELLSLYKDIYMEHAIAGHLLHLYTSRTLESIHEKLNYYTYHGRYPHGLDRIKFYKEHQMTIPSEWVSWLFYPDVQPTVNHDESTLYL